MATYNGTIASGSYDAKESSGTVTVDGTVLACSGTSQYIGLTFPSFPVVAGATITAATLGVDITSTAYDDPDVKIYCQVTQADPTWVASTNNISGRSRTTAYTTWAAGSLGAGVKTSADFAAAVQEYIDDGSYVAGGPLIVIIRGNVGSTLRITAYEGGTPATISVTFTPPAQTLTGQYITPTTTLYTGELVAESDGNLTGQYIAPTTYFPTDMFIYDAAWFVDDVQYYTNNHDNSFGLTVTTSPRSERGIVLFIASHDLLESTVIQAFIVDNGENLYFTQRLGGQYTRILVLPDPPVGAVEILVNLGGDYNAISSAVAMSHIGSALLLTGGTSQDAAAATELSADVFPGDAVLSMSWTSVPDGGVGLTPLSGSIELINDRPITLAYQRTSVNLTPVLTAAADITVGATAVYPGFGTPYYKAVALHVSKSWQMLTGRYIAPTFASYGGTLEHDGLSLDGAYLAPAAVLYGGTLLTYLNGTPIAPTAALYGGTLEQADPVALYLIGSFIGLGQPAALNGAYLTPATTLFLGTIRNDRELTGAVIVSTVVVHSGAVSQAATTATGHVGPGVLIQAA